jgi:hypothetical protein
MGDFANLDGLLWTLAALAAAWAFAPPLVTLLGRWRIRCLAANTPQAVEPRPGDADYEARYRELLALGFQPVGVLTEELRLFAIHWYKAFPIHCLATPDGTCYAGLYRMADEPVRVKFDTFLTGDFLVRTVMPGVGWEDRDEWWLRLEVPTTSVAELYDRHRENVGWILRETKRSVLDATLEDCARIDEMTERQRTTRAGGAGGIFFVLPGVFFLFPALLGLLATYLFFGVDALAVGTAGSCALGAAVYGLFLKVLLPWLITRASSEAPASAEA